MTTGSRAREADLREVECLTWRVHSSGSSVTIPSTPWFATCPVAGPAPVSVCAHHQLTDQETCCGDMSKNVRDVIALQVHYDIV